MIRVFLVVISGLISPLIWVISIVTLLVTLLITTHEPPSRGVRLRTVSGLQDCKARRDEPYQDAETQKRLPEPKFPTLIA